MRIMWRITWRGMQKWRRLIYNSFLQPPHIGSLPSLTELWLDHNQLYHLPPVSFHHNNRKAAVQYKLLCFNQLVLILKYLRLLTFVCAGNCQFARINVHGHIWKPLRRHPQRNIWSCKTNGLTPESKFNWVPSRLNWWLIQVNDF